MVLVFVLLFGEIAKSIGCSILLDREDGVVTRLELVWVSFCFSVIWSSGIGVVDRDAGEEFDDDDIDIIDWLGLTAASLAHGLNNKFI